MDSLGRNILEHLLENQGFPHTVTDFIRRLEGQAGEESVRAAVQELAMLGYVYITNGYVYPTTAATKLVEGQAAPSQSYDRIRQKYKDFFAGGAGVDIKVFKAAFSKHYPHYKKNHPEYNRFYQWLENSEKNWGEFIKEVLHTFMRWELTAASRTTFPGEEAYQASSEVVSVEHAIDEVIARFIQYIPAYKHLFDNRDRIKEAYDTLTYNLEDIIADVSQRVDQTSGAVIDDLTLQNLLTVVLKGRVPDINPEAVNSILAGLIIKLKQHISRIRNKSVVFSDSDFEVVKTELRNSEQLVQNITKYRKETRICNMSSIEFISKLMSLADFSKRALGGIDLQSTNITGTSFLGADLSKSSWQGATVEGCDFSIANLKSSNFKVAAMSNCDLDRADFEGANVSISTIDWETMSGNPTAMLQKEIVPDKKNIANIVKSNYQLGSKAFPIEEDDYFDATTIALALQKFLNKHLKVEAAIDRFNFRRFSALAKNKAKQLRDWLDGGKEPTFDYGDNLLRWLVEQNKSQELQGAGFSSKDVNTLFGKARNLLGPTKKEDPQVALRRTRAEKLQQFAQSIQGKEEIPVKLLRDLIFANTGSKVLDWISEYGEALTIHDAHSLYVSLVSTLKGFHIHSEYRGNLKRPYEAFPYNTYFSDLKNTRHGVAGAGVQFGVALTLDHAAMPPRLRQIADYAIDNGTSHLANAICFSRIAPYEVIERDAGDKAYRKLVWYVTEMQADDYQKLGSRERGLGTELERRFGKAAVREYRRFFRQWPENLLNVILKAAKAAGVTEVWVPEHTEVEAKTFSGRTSESNPGDTPNWYNSYDRPAKVFNGQLEHIGEQLQLDPGSGYPRKAGQAYVIQVSPIKQASLKFNYGRELQALADLSDYDWDALFENGLKHHINWIIQENRPKFPEIEKYVSDEMVAQYGWATFFSEYSIPQENLQDPEFIPELKRLFTEELGYQLYDPPYIDWLHWMQKAWDDVRFYMRNQREITPDLNIAPEEMARDWLKLWEEEQVPADIVMSSWYRSKFLSTIQVMLDDRGFGDVLGTDYVLPPADVDLDLLFNPPDNDEGEKEFVDRDGNVIPGPEGGEEEDDFMKSLNFSEPDSDNAVYNDSADSEDRLNDLLDQLNIALDSGDTRLIQEIKQEIEELSSNSSLKLSWQLDPPDNVHKDFSADYWSSGERMPKRIGFDTHMGVLLVYVYSNPGVRFSAVKRALLYNPGRAKAFQRLKQLGLIVSDRGSYSVTAYGKHVVENADNDKRIFRLLTLDNPEITDYLYRPRDSEATLKLSWQVEGPVSWPSDPSFTEIQHKYLRNQPSYIRKDSMKGRILSWLYVDGEIRLIDLWKRWVTHRGFDPEELRREIGTNTYRRELQYFQGVSSACTYMKHLGLVAAVGGKYRLTQYGIYVFEQSVNKEVIKLVQPGAVELQQFYYKEGRNRKLAWQIHDDSRVEVDEEGNKRWYNDQNELHRLDGPAIEYVNGDKSWYQNGKRHRLDGPATEWADGVKEWYQQGRRHRLDGPAMEWTDGETWWYQNGKLHRLDGPAAEWVDGSKKWYINGDFIGSSFDGFTAEDFENYKRENGLIASQRLAWQIHDDSELEVDEDGNRRWVNDQGQLHRVDGPAIEWTDGATWWYQNGKLHRLDGPAIEYVNGDKSWYQNGKRHRLDGPAIEWVNGDKSWYQNGKRHRLDGPAIEWVDGSKKWYINGDFIGSNSAGFTAEDFENYKRENGLIASQTEELLEKGYFNRISNAEELHGKAYSSGRGKKASQSLAFAQAEEGAQERFNEEVPQNTEKTQLDIVYPTVEDIFEVHIDVLQDYGGSDGVLANGQAKVQAAIGRMQSGFGDTEFYPSLIEKAAVLMHSIITTHPFMDGNKRTAFMAGMEFLEDNGLTINDAEGIADIIIGVANNENSYEHLLGWIEQHKEEIEELGEKGAPIINAMRSLAWTVELTTTKILRACKPFNEAWMWAESGEIVVPNLLTERSGLYGVKSRLGTAFAKVFTEEVDLLELARADLRGFWKDSWEGLDSSAQDRILAEKELAFNLVLNDLRSVPDGAIISVTNNPETTNKWYKIYKD